MLRSPTPQPVPLLPPPWPGGRARRAQPGERPAQAGGLLSASVNRSFLSAWGVGAGGGSCLGLCYVLKKKAKNLGHKPQTVLLSAQLAQTGIFSVVSGRPRPGLAGLGGERPEVARLARGGWAGRGWASRWPWVGVPHSGNTCTGAPAGARLGQLGGTGPPGGVRGEGESRPGERAQVGGLWQGTGPSPSSALPGATVRWQCTCGDGHVPGAEQGLDASAVHMGGPAPETREPGWGSGRQSGGGRVGLPGWAQSPRAQERRRGGVWGRRQEAGVAAPRKAWPGSVLPPEAHGSHGES